MSEQPEINKLVEECLAKLCNYAYYFYGKQYRSYSSIIDYDVENYKGDIEIVNILKQIKLIANKKLNLNEIINYVCKYDFVNSLEYLINEFNISLDCIYISRLTYVDDLINEKSCSPLHVCIEHNAKKCFNLLIEKGSSVHIYKYSKSYIGVDYYTTLIEQACCSRNIYYVEQLILHGCDLVTSKNEHIIDFCFKNNMFDNKTLVEIINKRKFLIKNQISENIKDIPDDLIYKIINKLY